MKCEIYYDEVCPVFNINRLMDSADGKKIIELTEEQYKKINIIQKEYWDIQDFLHTKCAEIDSSLMPPFTKKQNL